ncbi:MAG: NAD-dependent aldehyde dehydrogenase [Acidimicrobiales bacterium]|nr:NAD-dependent aldehyde dehydrogenase [Acidimicrobiales bacterium]
MTELRPVRIGDEQVTTEETITVRSPFDGHEIAQVPSCTSDHVDRAVAAAREHLADPLPAWKRAEVLDTAARVVADHQEELARIIAEEAAKPIRTARTEAARAVLTFQYAAVEARTLVGEMVPMEGAAPGAGKLGFTLRVPVGVVGAISPFNFPLNLVAHKIAPAIAAGCPVVLKPASQTPLSAIRLVELLIDDCGLPPGFVNVVTGSGQTVGNALVDHPDIALITFTGSPPVGWGIKARAPKKHVNLELGNNAPVIIEPSGAWEVAADKIKVAGFSHAGQSCISTQRIYVHRSIAEGFTDALVAKVRELHVGDPLDEETDVSALISGDETKRVAGWIAEAVEGGAQVATGGDVVDGILQPTVLTGVRPDMEVCRNEVFGPVVAIAAYDDLDEALAQANDTRYGLQAGIFTGELATALRAGRELDFGGVLVNEVPTFRTDQMPYGGVRDSGNTKEGPHYAVRAMTVERLVILQS